MDIAKPSSLHILASLKLPVLCLARLGVHPCGDACCPPPPASSAETRVTANRPLLHHLSDNSRPTEPAWGTQSERCCPAAAATSVPGPWGCYRASTGDCMPPCLAAPHPGRDERRICRYPSWPWRWPDKHDRKRTADPPLEDATKGLGCRGFPTAAT
jgi:hypothetical protein